MCLNKTHIFPKISRKPIIVCKLFFELSNGQLNTPYVGFQCKCGDIIKASKPWYKGIFKNTIEEEGVHAYVFNREHYYQKFFNFHFIYCYICIIPPFTPYWTGENNDICATKMKIITKL